MVLPRDGVVAEMYRDHHAADELRFEPGMIENPFEPWSRAMVREDYEAPVPLRGARLMGNVARAAFGLRGLGAALKREGTDLVYCNGTNANFAGGAIANLFKIPALWHVRYTHIPPAASWIHDSLAASEKVRRIVCVSEASRSLFPRIHQKTAVVHNAIDLTQFQKSAVVPCLRKELQIPKGDVIFGSFGRVLPRKGYLEMVEAAKRMKADMSPEEWSATWFIVLGDTPEDLRPNHLEECIAKTKELGVDDRFRFLGFREDVRPYVADFDISVVPSVYPDPLPRAVIESMGFELPVIGFALGGIQEMIQDGRNGRLLSGNPPDVEGLARAMLQYRRDGALREAQGKTAREHVVKHFDAAAHGKAISAEMDRAIATRG